MAVVGVYVGYVVHDCHVHRVRRSLALSYSHITLYHFDLGTTIQDHQSSAGDHVLIMYIIRDVCLCWYEDRTP